MSEKFKAPRGTFDVLPEQQPVRRRIVEVAQRRLEDAAYGRMDTPISVADAASRGNRIGLSRLSRARHADARAADEALD